MHTCIPGTDTNYVHRLMTLLSRGNSEENGFTLVEVLVTIVILSVLSGIAIPVTLGFNRNAVLATLKSDIRGSVPLLVNVKTVNTGNNNFPSPASFQEDAVTSKGNALALSIDVSGVEPVACITGTHVFSSTDTVSYHYSSDSKTIGSGTCEGQGSATPSNASGSNSGATTPTSSPVTSTSPTAAPTTSATAGTSTGSGTGTVQPVIIRDTDPTDAGATSPTGIPQDGRLITNVNYMPQTNKLNFCYEVSVKTNEKTPVAWQYVIDLNQGPFWGADPAKFTSTYNYTTKSLKDGLWTVTGTPGGWNEYVFSDQPRTFGFCVDDVPEPPYNAAWFVGSINIPAGNGNYYACLNVTATSNSLYPVPWTVKVDLKTSFKSIIGKLPTFTNLLSVKDLGNNVYEISGSGYNKYVDVRESRTSSQQICYYPNGSLW